MAHNNPKKNERLKGKNYKYKENYIIKVNLMRGVSEYQPKEDTFEVFEKQKENRFDESKQRYENENENLIETNRRERNSYPIDPLENRYNHAKAKKRGIHGSDILKNIHWI